VRDPRAGGAPALQGPPGHHRDPRHRRALRRGPADRPAGAQGRFVRLEDTIAGFTEILDGKHDDLPEQAFYMVGAIDEAVAKARGAEDTPDEQVEAEAEAETEAEAEAVPA
jgi:hypothetical protein